MARSGRSSRNDDGGRAIVKAQWIGDEGNVIEPPQSCAPTDPVEAMREAGQWLARHVEVAGDLKATSGPRLGSVSSRSQRTGSDEEIVTPLLVRPLDAIAAARNGDVFDRPLRRVKIEIGSLESHGSWSTWLATVRTGLFRARAATLRIGPSASGNLTVVQLVPQSTRGIRTRSFIDAGQPAVEDICGRLARRRVA